MAEAINEACEGPFAHLSFTDDELEELKVSAWLHDVGKITTPEYVVDKATKLETLCDRIELVRLRIELAIHERLLFLTQGEPDDVKEMKDPEIVTMREDMAFLERLNRGAEAVTDETRARLQRIASQRIRLQNRWQQLLTEEELENLSIRRGTSYRSGNVRSSIITWQ